MFANSSHLTTLTSQKRVYPSTNYANTKKLVKKLARIEGSSVRRQQFANVLADSFCAVRTHQLEFANFCLPCEGRSKLLLHVKLDLFGFKTFTLNVWRIFSLRD